MRRLAASRSPAWVEGLLGPPELTEPECPVAELLDLADQLRLGRCRLESESRSKPDADAPDPIPHRSIRAGASFRGCVAREISLRATERLDAHVVGTCVEVPLNAGADGLLVAPGDDRIDERVGAAVARSDSLQPSQSRLFT